MNPLFQRISHVESELSELRKTTKRLSQTVETLKGEINAEETPAQKVSTFEKPEEEVLDPLPVVSKIVPKTSPPPLPETPEEKQSAPALDTTSIKADNAALELHLGRVWSVRLGILLLTTGFVFLSHYTYDNIIRELGPGIRLAFMYLFSIALTGAGLYCERWKESLKSYGSILAAGGLAAVYYCGFAAHNVEALRVIDSPVVASIVLTLSAGLFCGISLWRKSRLMLGTSLALAFYSISMNPIGWMACLSAVVLAAFGIMMMIRNRWLEIGFLALVGSYLSYTWWQFAVSQGDSSISRWFLVSYWILFAAASFVAARDMDEENHIWFTSLNNGAFFFLFSFQLELGTWMEQHWLFCFIFGAILTLIGLTTGERFSARSRIVHLTKGIGIITLGLALLLNGHQLFVALLIEAVALMALNLKIPRTFTKTASWGIGILSCVALTGAHHSEIHPLIWLFGVAAWLVIGTIHRFTEHEQLETRLHTGGMVASILAMFMLVFGLMLEWQAVNQALSVGLIGMLAGALGLWKPLRNHAPEFLVTSFLSGLAALASLYLLPDLSLKILLTAALLSLLGSIAPVNHHRLESGTDEKNAFHLSVAALVAIGLGFLWMALDRSGYPPGAKLVIALIIPFAGTMISKSTGLLAHSAVPFLFHLIVWHVGPLSSSTLMVGLVITLLHLVFVRKFHRLLDRPFIETALAVFAAIFWGLWLISITDHPALPLTLTSVALLMCKNRLGSQLSHFISAPYFALGMTLAFLNGSPGELYLCLVAPLALHLTHCFMAKDDKFQTAAVISLLLLWIQITRNADLLPLAAVWALTGTVLLLGGLGLKSRCFRLIGLIILAFSLGHLMLFDLVKLDPLPRILSFMTLGFGLLGLGYVYNRWQDRLKQIL